MTIVPHLPINNYSINNNNIKAQSQSSHKPFISRSMTVINRMQRHANKNKSFRHFTYRHFEVSHASHPSHMWPFRGTDMRHTGWCTLPAKRVRQTTSVRALLQLRIWSVGSVHPHIWGKNKQSAFKRFLSLLGHVYEICLNNRFKSSGQVFCFILV